MQVCVCVSGGLQEGGQTGKTLRPTFSDINVKRLTSKKERTSLTRREQIHSVHFKADVNGHLF